jgi:hypothetical protein
MTKLLGQIAPRVVVPSNTVGEVADDWQAADVLPEHALCERDFAGRYAELGEAVYTPYRCVPSASSRSDIGMRREIMKDYERMRNAITPA